MAENSKSELIKHAGVVSEINNTGLKVVIEPQSACGSCNAKSICSAGSKEVKIIEISGKYPNIKVGQNVTVALKQSVGYRALLFGYLIPFVVLMVALLAATSLTSNEAIAGLFSLAATAFYYLILFFFRKKIKKSVEFVLYGEERD
ncbi:MAG: hypothetical protein A2275_17425 [Bacteroidetes bacterium RIFOXYA12_FULL_35_11]|nr:MAG: hypothetical protein A2X01_19735 [Bacteroidetes bacterium GWF2_35_48]OFY76261.1 MAG: hypothetical protein A2275_17425 [Bacteroidetes bacterium RIFOXYA12_FULL_35_11]OFY92557.1 MAG: hypothetical protein A2491_10175 [Bacteroidetes bacterium RIFOXYC12_FULL_35_7]OFY94726.1 MAG: hypothetical protein A2309_14580 [Bacteroidetes bacterium RIFOXYB2_FULL_35_7]HBX52670.1 RseC/MucC family positive regulator of sigma(E) [Bacteroidales bacterium]